MANVVTSVVDRIKGRDPKREEKILDQSIKESMLAEREALKILLLPGRLMRELRFRLEGFKENPEKEGGWDRPDESSLPEGEKAYLLNDKGVRDFMSVVGGVVNENTILGNITAYQAEWLCRSTDAELKLLVYKNWDKYDLDISHRNMVVSIAMYYVQLALSRAIGGHTSKMIGKTTHIESRETTQPSKEGGRQYWGV